MIKLLTPPHQWEYLAMCDNEPVLGARMHTQLAVYGCDSPIATHWLATDETGWATAAILRFDGWVVIVGGNGLDIKELADFLLAIGEFRYIESSPEICMKLARFFPGKYSSSVTMRCKGEPFDADFSAIDAAPPLREVFDLICSGSSFMADTTCWDSWYPHTSHLLRHNLGFSAVIRGVGGRAIATGGIYTANTSYAIISSLTTLAEFRGQGLGGLMLQYLCNACFHRGLTPALYCAEDQLAAFYGRYGFRLFGHWAEIALAAI